MPDAMSEIDFEAWRTRGQRVGRQIIQVLDVIALEEAIRVASTGLERAHRRETGYAYRLGLRDALKEHRQAARQTQ
jgi:hypothetical protein